MDILGGASLLPGLVVLADQQTQGRGRGGNLWISPPGCAMFSLQVKEYIWFLIFHHDF